LRSVSLSLKLTVCLIGGMVIIFSVFGYKIIHLHRANLEEQTYASGDRITETIKRSMRNDMLHNRSLEIHEIVATIGTQPGIEKIRIFNKAGEVKFSTDPGEIATRVDKQSEGCAACHAEVGRKPQLDGETPHQLTRSERMRIYEEDGGRTLSVINPIENEPNCSSADCHAHAPETKLLGMINVRMSLEPVDAAIAESRRQMTLDLVFAIVALSLVIGALLWAIVYRPVRRLIVGTERVAAGDLDHKIAVSSRDELGNLAKSFNRMTGELKQANEEIVGWARTLESRVEAKSRELSRTHEVMLRVEKLASIGKLAAIVAHEINNPLAGILVYAKLLLKRAARSANAGADAEAEQYLEIIAAESARCGEIVKGLLQFSRQNRPNMEPNDVNEIVRQSVRLVQHKIDLMNVRAEIDLDGRARDVVCDVQQLKQALVALLINACEAMPSGGGVLTVRTRYPAEDLAAEIIVADDGVGMDEETKRHIFEPFYSTKEQGKGVGLGLAVVYGIVLAHGGAIEVESAPGAGTTFTIRLPGEAEAASLAASAVASTEQSKEGASWTGEILAS
jgi:two-component system NtrC family sensor kinase